MEPTVQFFSDQHKPLDNYDSHPLNLMAKFTTLESKLHQEGSEADAELMRKAMERLARYQSTVQAKVEANPRLPMSALSQLGGEGFPLQVVLADRIDETGGRRYGDNGSAGTWYRDAAEVETYPAGSDEGELVSGFPSQQGMVELMRGLGVLKANAELNEANQTITDAIISGQREASTTHLMFKNPADHLKFPFDVALPTRAQGVTLRLERKQFSLGGEDTARHTEQVVALQFTPEALERFIERGKISEKMSISSAEARQLTPFKLSKEEWDRHFGLPWKSNIARIDRGEKADPEEYTDAEAFFTIDEQKVYDPNKVFYGKPRGDEEYKKYDDYVEGETRFEEYYDENGKYYGHGTNGTRVE